MSKPANRRSGNPAVRAAAAGEPKVAPRRPRGYALLAWLHRRPRWLVPLLTVVLTLGGMFLPPLLGGLCLLVVAGFLSWLAALAWPRLGGGARIVRIIVIGMVVAVAFARMTGQWVA